MFVIREYSQGPIGSSRSADQYGYDWWRGDRWTPASDEAKEFDTREEAESEAREYHLRAYVVVEID